MDLFAPILRASQLRLDDKRAHSLLHWAEAFYSLLRQTKKQKIYRFDQ